MPFPFTLPTTSSFHYSASFDCDSHPSLPLNASTYRGVVRDVLKKFKRLPPGSQASQLATVISALKEYAPYPLLFESAIKNQPLPSGETISIIPKAPLSIEWRPSLSGDVVPGREKPRVKISSLDEEISFVLSTLGLAQTLNARFALQPLYSTSTEFLGPQERTAAITTASKHLIDAASTWSFLATRGERMISSPPTVDIAPSTARALASLAHGEATLLAILKDDPYPAAVAQDRNKQDKEWMFKAPEIPKVRAHLYARLSLAAAEHAGQAQTLLQSTGSGKNKIDITLIRYAEDLRRTSRAKACRFFGIDAELGGETAEGIGWLRAGFQELGVELPESKKGLSLSRLKKGFSEKREDRRVDKSTAWGADGGKLEETRVIELLDEKWNKINDTVSSCGPAKPKQLSKETNYSSDEHARHSTTRCFIA